MLSYQRKQANFASYRTTNVSTANRLKLLIMLYEGAIRFCSQAQQAMHNKDLAAKGQAISKSLAIINELRSTLDHSQAPELSQNLERLYDFINDRLIKANIGNDIGALMEAMKVIKILYSAWTDLAKKPLAELTATQPEQAEIMKKKNVANEDSYVRISV
ncbi:MAG: flagellar export chaperone FliS [Candidatus Lernaella stagnicola]|nr:flagellar export chaperone FliS [Candidatus Lernaella stagnicola]